MDIDKKIVFRHLIDKVELPDKCNKTKIKNLLSNGKKVSDISCSLGVSPQYVYKIIKKNKWKIPKIKKIEPRAKLTSWSEKKFSDVKTIAEKYHKKLSLCGIDLNMSDIECTLLDLIIHTDQKDIKNKDAYFRKYCPLKIANLKYKILSRMNEQLFDESGEEIYSYGESPENILIAYEEYIENYK